MKRCDAADNAETGLHLRVCSGDMLKVMKHLRVCMHGRPGVGTVSAHAGVLPRLARVVHSPRVQRFRAVLASTIHNLSCDLCCMRVCCLVLTWSRNAVAALPRPGRVIRSQRFTGHACMQLRNI